MSFNLISIGKLDNEGYHNHLGDKKWKHSKASLILPKGKNINTLYKTKINIIKGDVNVVEHDSSIEL